MKNISIKDQSIKGKSEQLIRYYKVPVILSKEIALNNLLSRIESQDTKILRISANRNSNKRIVVTLISAAASVALIVTLYVLTFTQTITNANSQIVSGRLPDDSRVILEKGSKINYVKSIGARKVRLSGSAYFEVEKGQRFIISSENGYVEVLGTRFMVTNISDEFSVRCFEGKVRTKYHNSTYLIEAGKQFTGSDGEGEKSDLESSSDYPEMAKFSKNYSNALLRDVATDLEDFFNVNIKIKDGIVGSFSGTIQSGSLENTIDIVCSSLSLKYKYTEKTKIEIFK